ncbi:hypothetical protein SHIRM173S_10151 [Streptomyces hirsutus]
MAQHSGMVPLPGADALRAFDAFLAGAEPRPGVVAYDPGFRRRARDGQRVDDGAGRYDSPRPTRAPRGPAPSNRSCAPWPPGS